MNDILQAGQSARLLLYFLRAVFSQTNSALSLWPMALGGTSRIGVMLMNEEDEVCIPSANTAECLLCANRRATYQGPRRRDGVPRLTGLIVSLVCLLPCCYFVSPTLFRLGYQYEDMYRVLGCGMMTRERELRKEDRLWADTSMGLKG